MTGTVKDALAVAARNVGFVEGPNNQNPYAPLVGHANNQPWCASFIAAVMKRAGVPIPSTSAYTPTMAQGFKNAGLWGRTPKVGAVVFFQWPNMGRIAHVGIVESIRSDGAVVCIEGNTDVAGGRTGGRVMRQIRRSNIAGYGYPKYGVGKIAQSAKVAPMLAGDPVLSAKTTPGPSQAIKNVQVALNKHRVARRLAPIPTDGRFGSQTHIAVRTFQGWKGLTVDGVVGQRTWDALRKPA